MKVNGFEGIVLEKNTDEREVKGQLQRKFILKIHQKGEDVPVKAKVSQATYDKAKEMSPIALGRCTVRDWSFNGKTGLSVTEDF